jgi:polysaccharide export outer membrane protein
VTAFAGSPFPEAAVPQDQRPVVESISFDVRDDRVLVYLRTSQPVPPFSCLLPSPNSTEAVIEVPTAVGRLQPRYAVDSPVIPEIRVEAASAEGDGVRLHMVLGEGFLAGVEHVDNGLVLRFEPHRAEKGPAGRSSSAEYRVGVGDKLEITVFAHEDLNKVVEVRSDGTINYPLIGVLSVAGKTTLEIDTHLTRLLGKDFLVDPQVSVDVREYQSQWVTIIGEIRQPGRYVLKRNMRLIDLLAEAGGATKEAGDEILITRRRERDGPPDQMALDRVKLLSGDSQEANVLLSHGDIVALPEKRVFYIRGEIARPASYFLEKGMTVMKAITVAGGLSQFANRKEIELLRSRADGVQEKIKINLKAIEDGKRQDVPVLPNDLIIVPRRIF